MNIHALTCMRTLRHNQVLKSALSKAATIYAVMKGLCLKGSMGMDVSFGCPSRPVLPNTSNIFSDQLVPSFI